eukprot:3291794-Amphidinium_carterae.1
MGLDAINKCLADVCNRIVVFLPSFFFRSHGLVLPHLPTSGQCAASPASKKRPKASPKKQG